MLSTLRDAIHASRFTFHVSRSTLHDSLLSLASHPLPFLALGLAGRLLGVARLPGIGYLVNDTAVARAILTDERHFSKRGSGGAGNIWTQLLGERAYTNMEGAEHRRLRSVLGYLTSDACLDALDREVLAPFRGLIRGRLARGEPVDLVPVARWLSAKAIHHALGIVPDPADEAAEYDQLFRLTRAIGGRIPLSARPLSVDALERSKRDIAQIVSLANRRIAAGEQLAGRLVDRLLVAGLRREEVLPLVALLLFLGTETVSTAMPRIAALLIDSGQLGLLRDRPDLLESAIDEGLRFTAPSPVLLRGTVVDRELGGARFRAGQRLVMNARGMLRRGVPGFDITRKPPVETRQLWFGHGPHFCIGAGLAEKEIATFLGMLIESRRDFLIQARGYNRQAMLPAYSRLVVAARDGVIDPPLSPASGLATSRRTAADRERRRSWRSTECCC